MTTNTALRLDEWIIVEEDVRVFGLEHSDALEEGEC